MFSEQNNNTVYSVSNKHSASIKIKQCHPQAQLCQKSNLIWRILLQCALDHMCGSEIWAILIDKTSGVVLRKQACHWLFLSRLSGSGHSFGPRLVLQIKTSQKIQEKLAELLIRSLKYVRGLINRLVPDPTGRPPHITVKEGTKLVFYSIAPHDAALHLCFQKQRAEVDVCDTAWMKNLTEMWRRRPK